MNPCALRFPIHLSVRLQSRSRWIGMTKWLGVGLGKPAYPSDAFCICYGNTQRKTVRWACTRLWVTS